MPPPRSPLTRNADEPGSVGRLSSKARFAIYETRQTSRRGRRANYSVRCDRVLYKFEKLVLRVCARAHNVCWLSMRDPVTFAVLCAAPICPISVENSSQSRLSH